MSQPLTVNIPHQLGREEAKRRVDEGIARFTQQVGGAATNFHKTWSQDRLNFSANVMGQAISGGMDVLDDVVRIELVLPGILGLMAGKIKGKLQKEGQLLLDKK